MRKLILLLIFTSLINSFAFAQGDTCGNPINLNPLVPITDNGKINIDVDNSSSGQFYTYTATQVGIIEMSSAQSNNQVDNTFDTWLRVYDENCNLIFDEDDTEGLLGGVEFRANVNIGDTYIYEWANHEWAGNFRVEFIYHVPVDNIECNNPTNLILGENLADNWFGAKYYSFTAPNDGELTISTCDYPFALFRNTTITSSCNDSTSLAIYDYSCDIEDHDLHTAKYSMVSGETVNIKMEGYIHMHYDYNFNASFEESLSTHDEDYNSLVVYPNPVENNLSIKVNNTNSVKHITLYDLSGKQLSVNWVLASNNTIKVDLNNFKAGVYILKANNTIKKIIKK